ncbi:MAG: hypothetical protein NWE92_10220 [Candidatus Bathyarchaeota archaeon]|nr:hypothetical protein [Candidatus Bathyarchaeota archaeon]
MVNELNTHSLPEKKKENLVTAIYIGSLFIILAVVYFLHAGTLWDDIVNFFSTLTLTQVPNTGISLPAPLNPGAHVDLYTAVFQFSIGVGFLEIIILALRIYLRSPLSRRAETVENTVFWLGTSYLTITYLVNLAQPAEWFVFWAGIILIFGLSLLARAFVLLANR